MKWMVTESFRKLASLDGGKTFDLKLAHLQNKKNFRKEGMTFFFPKKLFNKIKKGH